MGFLDWLGSDTAAVPAGAPSPDQVRELVLFKYDSCPYCGRVARVVEKLGLKLEYRDTIRDRSATSELRAATGKTTVPCLFIDGQPLFESADIVAWLEAYAKNVPGAARS